MTPLTKTDAMRIISRAYGPERAASVADRLPELIDLDNPADLQLLFDSYSLVIPAGGAAGARSPTALDGPARTRGAPRACRGIPQGSRRVNTQCLPRPLPYVLGWSGPTARSSLVPAGSRIKVVTRQASRPRYSRRGHPVRKVQFSVRLAR